MQTIELSIRRCILKIFLRAEKIIKSNRYNIINGIIFFKKMKINIDE